MDPNTSLARVSSAGGMEHLSVLITIGASVLKFRVLHMFAQDGREHLAEAIHAVTKPLERRVVGLAVDLDPLVRHDLRNGMVFLWASA